MRPFTPRPRPTMLHRLLVPCCLAPLALLALACSSDGPTKEDRERQIEIHVDTSRAYINMGEYERAEAQARKGLSLDPDNGELKLALARALQMQGTTIKILEAESIYADLPRDEDFRVCLGYAESLERKGLAYAEAADGVRAGERPVDDVEGTARELDETSRKSWARSAQLFREGLEMKPGNTELMNGLARVYALMGDLQEALTWCDATLEIVRNDRVFWKKQLDQENLTTDEEERFRAAQRRLDELEVSLRLLAANILVEQGGDQRAVEHLGRVIQLQPTLAQAYSLRASLLMELGRYEEVVADVDDFIARTQLPYEDAIVQRAFDIRRDAQAHLDAAANDG